MKQNRLNLYNVDMHYIRDLHRADDRVRSVSPQEKKENRVFLGIMIICNEKQYIVPLSSVKDKHIDMKPCEDFDKIYDKNGKLIAVLDFNLMIPVTDKQITKVDLQLHQNDEQDIKSRKVLCIKEIEYCRKPENASAFEKKANDLY